MHRLNVCHVTRVWMAVFVFTSAPLATTCHDDPFRFVPPKPNDGGSGSGGTESGGSGGSGSGGSGSGDSSSTIGGTLQDTTDDTPLAPVAKPVTDLLTVTQATTQCTLTVGPRILLTTDKARFDTCVYDLTH